MVNPVFTRIRQSLDVVPVVDVHSHLGTSGLWQARTLADLASYHWLSVEVARAAGRRIEADPQDNPSAYMREVLPFFPAIRNTANHFAFMGLLRDLYGTKGSTLTEDNWHTADEAVREHAHDPRWLSHVLDRAQIRKVLVCYEEVPPASSECFVPYEYGEYLYMADSLDALKRVALPSTLLPETPADLEKAIVGKVAWLAASHGVRALHIARYGAWAYSPASLPVVGAALGRLLRGKELSLRERGALISFCADVTAAAAAQHGMVLQLFHGSVCHTTANAVGNVSYWDPQFLRTHASHFHKHPDTRFDLFLGTRIPSHEATTLARVYANVMTSGAWWHAFTPSTMMLFFRDRLEMLPNTAWNAFFSDGYLVEWVYGKLLVTKNRLSYALAGMVEEGFLAEDDAVDIGSSLLYANPVAAYGLKT